MFWLCGRQGEKNGTFGQNLAHCALCERGLNFRVFSRQPQAVPIHLFFDLVLPLQKVRLTYQQ